MSPLKNTIYFVGSLNEKIKSYTADFLKQYGLKIIFTDKPPMGNRKIFFLKHFVSPLGNSASFYGLAFPSSQRAFVKFPNPKLLTSNCQKVSAYSDPLQLFSLTILHEFLHLKGMAHCQNKGCLMSKNNCKQGEGNGYCLSCLSVSKDREILCPSCAKEASKFIQARNSFSH